jgi:predicted GIY-YIG superfamily endonuclease
VEKENNLGFWFRCNMKIGGVYYLYFKSEPQFKYYGATNNLRSRLSAHLNKLTSKKHVNHKLQELFNKYGEKELIFQVLDKLEVSSSEIEFDNPMLRQTIETMLILMDKNSINIKKSSKRYDTTGNKG